MASNWVMAAAGVIFTIYLALPPDQQQAVVQHLPGAAVAAADRGFRDRHLARLWPQKSITSYREAKSETTTTTAQGEHT